MRFQQTCVTLLALLRAATASPVFIQVKPSPFRTNITYPTNTCLPCRLDQSEICQSAKVSCSDGVATEQLWASPDCEGPHVAGPLPASHAVCPSQDYYSPFELDLERFVPKMLEQGDQTMFPDEATVRKVILEYRRMLFLAQKDFANAHVVPSKAVDEIWHNHILDTNAYIADCQKMFGRYMHHAPSFDGDDKDALRNQFKEMMDDYTTTFGTDAPVDVWPLNAKVPADSVSLLPGTTPNCCMAFCVKPNCASCVGCDALDCGTLKGQLTHLNIHGVGYTALEPLQRKGTYTPETFTHLSLVDRKKQMVNKKVANVGVSIVYQFTINPTANIMFSWSMNSQLGQIDMELTLRNQHTWVAIGLGNGKPGPAMSGADIMVVLHSQNYTGVFDMFRSAPGNGYPCFDLLSECSTDNTFGTDDLTDIDVTRQGLTTTAKFSRAWVTGDKKDINIGKSAQQVLFAQGATDDYFTQHAPTGHVKGMLNFYDGTWVKN